jgi:cysteine desulfurase / selenocysteine lyase
VIDIERLRSETPGVRKVTHFNNAGAALMPVAVIEAMRAYFDDEILFGGYETARKRSNQIEAVYGSLAKLLGASRREIALADNATRAWDVLFYAMRLEKGDRILTTTSEYVSNWAAYLHARDSKGVDVVVVPDDGHGSIDLERLERMVDEAPTALITLNHMPTNGGVVNPAAGVGSIAAERGIPFLLDACQTVGQIPIDVNEFRCDMLTATSRKYLRGPRGVGFLYVRDEFIEQLNPVFVELENAPVVLPDRFDLATSARRFETWEKAYANVVGLGAAVDYATDIGVDDIWDRVQSLAAHVRRLLSEIDGVTVHDRGEVQGGIVTFDIDGRQPLEVQELLAERSINVSTCTPFSAPVDMHRRGIDGLVRASVHAYNTDEEIDELVAAVEVMA